MDDAKRLELIAEAIRYCQRVKALGMPVSCYTKSLREAIHFLWKRRAGPKSRIPKYRSVASVGLRFGKGELAYDHAVPFKYLQAALLDLVPVTEAAVTLQQALTIFCRAIACESSVC
jgi:hypothetical protein